MKVSLAELQTWMAKVVSHPEGVAAALASDASCAAAVLESKRLSRVDRLGVYAEAYFSRLEECLAEDFPAIRSVIGPEPYEEMLHEYLIRHPSDSSLLNELGRHMPEFLARHPLTGRFPFLPELARLERRVMESAWAEMREWPEFPSLAEWGEDELSRAVLLLDPSVKCHASSYPLASIWTNRSLGGASPAKAAEHQLVYRADARVRVAAVSATEFKVLEYLASREPLGELLGALENLEDFDFQRSFAEWRGRGVVRGITLVRKQGDNSGRFWS